MDILLMPTVREGVGLSIAESMSCGLLVVASDYSTMPQFYDEGQAGLLCRVGDMNAFIKKINLSTGSPYLRQKYRRI
jgi:glycosyltransferase involved in cell wall biosynthesis